MTSQQGTTEPWEPKIIAFLCNWCSYTGADLAGVSRQKWPANVRVLRVMCSGRVDPTFVMQAFRNGADGVIISGCHPGDCHYVEGNYNALRRTMLLEQMLVAYGIDRRRLKLVWVSASEGQKWAGVAAEMTETIRQLGPLTLNAPAPVVRRQQG